MSKINKAIYEIHEMDELADKKSSINMIHPLTKLILTVVYIALVVSFDKYDIIGILPMLLYPLIIFNLSEISIKTALRKLRVVLPLVCFVGLFNPLFDTSPLVHLGGVVITGGMVSMLTLVIKGVYSLLASFLLVATTGIEKICYALRLLHIPGIIVTQILLVYRYVSLLMGEANAVIEAYSLRAPKQKGIKYKIWGTLIGQLLLRSIDRAENVFDSMLLRGFDGEFYFSDQRRFNSTDYIYLILWLAIMAGLRFINLAQILSIIF